MKTLLRILIYLFVFILLLSGAGYFTLTRPAIQKKLMEGFLPAGSSVAFVHITPGAVELRELRLRLPDGSKASLDRLQSEFSMAAAVFDQTVLLRGLRLEGLVVQLPEATVPSGEGGTTMPPDSSAEPAPTAAQIPARAETAESPLAALYQIGEVDWLIDVDLIDLSGTLIDPSRNRYVLELRSERITPGSETELTANLRLESKEALQGGLEDFNSAVRVNFSQKPAGGFERVRIESTTEGSDAFGGRIVLIAQILDLSIDSFEESAEVMLSFNAELPRPGAFAPQLTALEGLSLQGELKAVAEGRALELQTANLEVASKSGRVARVELKQSLALGGAQRNSGELMDVVLSGLPLEWINPWLGEGLQLRGAPIFARVVVASEADGSLQAVAVEPIAMGPWSLLQNGEIWFEDLSLSLRPVLRTVPDVGFSFDLDDLMVGDRYGNFVSGTVRGSVDEGPSEGFLSGVNANLSLDIGLAELLRQPLFVDQASVMEGQLQLRVNIEEAADYPVNLQLGVSGLRAREMSGGPQDYRLAAQLKSTSPGAYSLGAKFEAGSVDQPSTSLQLAGQLRSGVDPIPFRLDLTAPRITQRDFDLLQAAAQSPVVTASSGGTRTPSVNAGSTGESGGSTAPLGSGRPPWAQLDGEASISIEEFVLHSGQRITGFSAQARVSEPLLELSGLTARLGEGALTGDARVVYAPSAPELYQIRSGLKFRDVDPAFFSQKASGSFPVRGLFDGDLDLSADGQSLRGAIDDSELQLRVTGRDGVLTAFELDNSSQLGLIGAGILGQSLNRPGITALAEAVPYFNNMKFDAFALELTRGKDKQMRLPELAFRGDSLRIEGKGLIAASKLSEVLGQPLDLSLELGAKGRLVDYLETLGLLKPATDTDGFRAWKQTIDIGGTLGDPDTSALREILNNAARSALRRPEEKSEATGAPKEGEGDANDEAAPSKEPSQKDRRRDDIERGLDLLNSVFG